ncbi:deoxyribonuclease-1-like [Gymnodraco acuticeps]|uniref:Deoxyribonuclease-1-like n=1 Tax=Gymnodraco acuticeps TaxID=8218 RepID=A0A6P8U4P8_GYMAC|nr:deoxyribonuclease-1-like [Gymnodraco acuticeps]
MKIAAFNVQRLGWDKVNNQDVRDNIIKIVSQYSVVVLLEVTDQSDPAMPRLLKHLNEYGDNKRNPYGMLCSEPLGPEGHKQKFVYFYRKKEVQIKDKYQYRGNAVITRKPFAVLLNCLNTVVQDLVLIPVHITPSNAEAELNALHDVVEVVRKKWKKDNIMILGDFNAAGDYLSMEQKETLLISSAPYRWLIGDDVHTMTKNNIHAYDRIVVYEERMLEAIVPDSAKAYNFKRELNLTVEEALSVSDHYPVEVELEEKPEVKTEVELEVKLMVEQMRKLELMVKLMVEQMRKLELMVKQEVEPEVELMVKLMVEQMRKLDLMVKQEVEPEVELMVEQMRKLELMVKQEVEPEVELMVEQKAQRKRNPEKTSTRGRPQAAQKKKAGPAAKKGKGV